MKKLTLFLFYIFIASQSFTQNTVSGIISNNKIPVEFCSVILMTAQDSSIIKASFTNEKGHYSIKLIDSGDYFIKTQLIGFEEYFTQNFNLKEEKIEVNIAIIEKSTTLGEFSVISKKPLLEQKAGKLVVNIADNATNINGSIRDVMKKVPGLLVTNNSVSVAGGGATRILIDGKSTDYLDINSMLNDIPSDNIEKIEIISQAGAEYEAAGTGAVINIILKSGKLNGFNGNLSATIGYAEEFRYSTAINLSYRKDKIGIHGTLGYYSNNNFQGNTINRDLGNYNYLSEGNSPNRREGYYPSMGIDYEFNKNTSAGFDVSYRKNRSFGIDNNTTQIKLNETIINKLNTNIKENNDWQNFSTSAYFQKKLDTNGQELNIKASYANFNDRTLQLFDILTSDVLTDNRENNNNSKNSIYAVKIDYKLPVNNNFILNFGGKYSNATVNSDVTMFNTFTGRVKNTQFSNLFEFQESIIAAYSKATFILKKDVLDGNIGLRWERSDSKGHSVDLDTTMTRVIDRVFPSFALNYNFSKKMGVALAYSQRINRPSYSTLNPYTYFVDPFTFERGNPFISPEIANTYKASLTYQKQPFFNLEYSKTKQVMALVTEQNSTTGEGYALSKNLNSLKKYGASLFFPLSFIPKVNGYVGVMGYYNVYEDEGIVTDNNKLDKTTMVLFLQASYALTNNFELDYNAWYNSGGLEGIMDYQSMYGMSLGAEYKMLDDQLTISANWSDFLNKFYTSKIAYQDVKASIQSNWLVNVVSLKVKWNFGNKYLKQKEKKSEAGSEEINRAN